eukprot:403353141
MESVCPKLSFTVRSSSAQGEDYEFIKVINNTRIEVLTTNQGYNGIYNLLLIGSNGYAQKRELFILTLNSADCSQVTMLTEGTVIPEFTYQIFSQLLNFQFQPFVLSIPSCGPIIDKQSEANYQSNLIEAKLCGKTSGGVTNCSNFSYILIDPCHIAEFQGTPSPITYTYGGRNDFNITGFTNNASQYCFIRYQIVGATDNEGQKLRCIYQ